MRVQVCSANLSNQTGIALILGTTDSELDTIMMTKRMKWGVTWILTLTACGSGVTAAQESKSSDFYKEPSLFSTRPQETKSSEIIARFGPVGMAIELVPPAFVMKVGKIEDGSPAAATGKFVTGQIIETINGQALKDIDPRIQLGNLITEAEAKDGVVKFMLKDNAAAPAQEVVVKIPVLGAYSKTWPLNCPKSDKIVRDFANYLAKDGSDPGFSQIGMLFLLGTGDDQDLPTVKKWVHGLVGKRTPTYAWHMGYSGIPLCEYYLRTGDPVALPLIQTLADTAVKEEFMGGWSQKGHAANVTYGGGGGLHNAAGTSVVTFLMLAKECGVNIPDRTLNDVLAQFFTFAGRGNNPYGDNKPELGFVDNGKNGTLSFAMAAAAALTPDGEKSVYAGARDVTALTAFYTTTFMLHGHTGGGIGELWRSASMGLLREKRPLLYREFMDQRRWNYELSRRFDGSFGILGGASYDNVSWGAGYALTYIVPRKTLRVTGAPPSRFSKRYTLPVRPWGTAADDAFDSIESAVMPDGTRPDFSGDTLVHDSGLGILRWISKPETTDAKLLQYLHHPDYMVRLLAARSMMGMETYYLGKPSGEGPIRAALIKPLLHSKDARVRRAVIQAISDRFMGEDLMNFLGQKEFETLMARLADPEESWWVKEGILMLASRLPAEPLVPHLDLILAQLKHPAAWIQSAGLTALAPVVGDERCYRKVLPAISEMLKHCQRWSASSPMRAGPLSLSLAAMGPEAQKFAAECLKDAFIGYSGKNTAAGGLDISTVYRSHMEGIATSMASMPGGYDLLYDVAKERFPNSKLPYDKIFLSADPGNFGPKLKQAIVPLIRDHVIYEFMATNRSKLLDAAAAKTQSQFVGGSNPLNDLIGLYQKVGVHEYVWKPFYPGLKNATWAYHMFDPAEKQTYDISPWRYRKVTLPGGMEDWFKPGFDPAKAGWKQGQAPFGQFDGKLVTDMTEMAKLKIGIERPMRTLWDKEVLLMRGTFDMPALKPGHVYRLLLGDSTNVGCGDGYRIYINGKLLIEQEGGIGRREGGRGRGAFLTKEFLGEFGKGPVTIAATSFMRYGNKAVPTMPPLAQNTFDLWMEEAKLPPLDDASFRKAAAVVPMLSAEWQAKQDPADAEVDPLDGRFVFDGKFVANPSLSGTWQTVAMVAGESDFQPAAKGDTRNAPFKDITFQPEGATASPDLIWSGDLLMDIKRFEVLKIVSKSIGGADYLFIETGGFSNKQPVGWKCPLVVLKRNGP